MYELQALSDDQVAALLRRALEDERGLADPPSVDDDALAFLAARSGATPARRWRRWSWLPRPWAGAGP